MQPEHIADLVVRVTTTSVLAFAGSTGLAFPGCFAAICPYFSRLNLASPYEERLHETLEARKDAENIPMWLGRMLGLVTLGLAALPFVYALPPILPYALWCLFFTATSAFAFLRFRQAAQRRVAALIPRDLRSALPPAVIVAVAACVAIELLLALDSRYHVEWAAVGVTSAMLLWIGWQIAEAPALILGTDIPVERYVDERLRSARTMNVAGLAIAPMILLLGATHDFSPLGAVAWIIAAAAGVVATAYVLRATGSIEPKSALAAMNAQF